MQERRNKSRHFINFNLQIAHFYCQNDTFLPTLLNASCFAESNIGFVFTELSQVNKHLRIKHQRKPQGGGIP